MSADTESLSALLATSMDDTLLRQPFNMYYTAIKYEPFDYNEQYMAQAPLQEYSYFHPAATQAQIAMPATTTTVSTSSGKGLCNYA